MKNVIRRTKGIRWDLWHRTAVRQSLEILVMNRVVRRAEVDPPRYRNGIPAIRVDRNATSAYSPSVNFGGQGWFTRFFRRRADPSITYMRHRA